MEQGATSQPGVTTRVWSRAIPNTPRGPLPQDLPRPKENELIQTKETGEPSPRERTHDTNQEKVDMNPETRTRGTILLGDLGKKIHTNWRRL
ncbi:hypothetical protein LIER_12936 [Lithospermum erythrorhizon]|uniref:Uncharacterized protein n=1 Tax=Lithospermum erythrorhizon TaxID=34254 RepID=A0AAV3PVI9_LITER